MEFSDLFFLYILFPAVVLIYFLMPDLRRKNLALLVVSLIFYAMGQPLYVGLIVALSFLNYKLALRIDPEDRATVILPVCINICVLVFFRALEVFLEASAVFPLGLSFYVLSVISYLVDVYEQRVDAEEDFQSLLLYFMMFPKLLQGPVVRYEQVDDQLRKRRHSPRAVFEGVQRFLFGLAKKVLLADYCGRIFAEVNSIGGDTTLVGVWFAAILFMFRIYYDFSGYCDMAIGLGKIFGFRYCENFKRPYLALSVSEFCRRWHISLGSFFRDYVYLPLGGKEFGKSRQVLHILIVCVLMGLWHGSSWNYVLWGLYFFVILVVENHFMSTLEILPDWIGRSITLWLVLVGWIIFSHENFADLQAAFLGTLGFGDFATVDLGYQILNSLPLMIVCVVGCTQFPVYAKRIFDGVCGMGHRRVKPEMITPLRLVHLIISVAVMCLLLWLCTASLVGNPALPSIYGSF